jgi:hypothetical protein
MSTAPSSIVDVPKKADSEDLFGINKYEKGLIRFIQNADTPITVAIQGEWGSGKTSLMNSLQNALCGDLQQIKDHKKDFYGIWVNTWQYSLMNSQEETLVAIVTSISTQIMNIISSRHEGLGQKISGSVFNFLGRGVKTVAKVAADKVLEGGGDVVEALVAKEKSNQTIKSLRDDLQKAISECLEKDRNSGHLKKGFLFFIDDLDRIDPPAAVQILELLKNIFDLEKCVFILAIDYDVVVKGLKPKFGELTEKNEREFRSFFDKIIQMPFSMPVASYSIDNFLIQNLQKIGYLSEQKMKDSLLAQHLSSFCSLSVGTNPRSLKRLLNTVSLINIIGSEDLTEDGQDDDDARLILNFALICVQIAYPAIYKALSIEGDFKSWDENIALQLKLEPLLEEEKAKLNDSEEFDEIWEQVVFRICKRDTYLSNRAVQISQLLNLILKLIPEGQDLGSYISEVLSLSSVTDVQAFDKPSLAINKGKVLKDFSRAIVPVMKSRLRSPWKEVNQASKRVMSNVYLSFGYSNLKHVIGVTVQPVKDHISLQIWYHPWAFTAKGHSMAADIKAIGLGAEYESVKSAYEALPSRHKNLSFRYPPMEKAGFAKGYHVPLLTLQLSFSDVSKINDPQNLLATSEIMFDFIEQNLKLNQLISQYTEKVPRKD